MPAPAPRHDGGVDPRIAGLRRMRTIATALLVLMAAVFVATSLVKFDWPWLPYLRAFAEAGMVGACADWFAVVALFRRPFGLPIPHTGIIPDNKERIGSALGRFITNNFLTATAMNERLARLDVIGSLAQWMEEPANAKRLGDYVALVLPSISRSLPTPQIGETLGKLTLQALEAVPAAPFASKMLAILWAHGEAQALVARAIDYGEDWLTSNKNFLTHKVSEQSSRWVPKWVDKMIAEKVISGLLSTLGEMRDPAHPWRLELQKAIERLIADLAADPRMHAQAERFKAEFLANPLLIEQARTLWTEVESGLTAGFPAHTDQIAHACEQALRSTGAWLRQDDERKAGLNRRIRVFTQRLLLLYRFEIGGYIERVVHNWDTATLVDRLELQVGKDLQYIRINGTLVGGLVGVMIFIAGKWIAMF
jgi:uncharacterized membrane-anchored protein YjiN (DUF445 family)